MSDILITSSLLILALLVLRRVFRGVVSRRVQYALWGLVLLRLLIPASILDLPATDFSVLTAARPVQAAVEQRANMHAFYSRPVREMTPEDLAWRDIRLSDVPTAEDGSAMILMRPITISALPPQQEGYLVRDPDTDAVTLYADMAVGPWEILSAIWKGGMVLMGTWFVLSNARFYGKLRKNRTVYETGSKRRVYLVPEGVLPSPCLFGGAIYLTPAAVESPDKLRHVLAHEETHARHWDPLWSLLRCVCLTVYWFDPLVWIAAACAKADCELACDEGALERLGEDQRIPYGKTLLSLIPVRKGPVDPMISATTMTAGKKQLKDRITRIAQNPRQVAAAVLAVAVLMTVVAACTFTGGYNPAPTESGRPAESVAPVEVFGPVALTGEELRWFNENFFNSPEPEAGYQYNIRNQFANPINLYDKPEDIDLHELLYCDGDAYSEEDYQALGIDPANEACPSYKLTAEQIDVILKVNMGLTLEQTNKVNFTYRYDETLGAYTWSHGDTNYCGNLNFLYGTREKTEDGSLLRLYHNSNFAGSSWYCVTLWEREMPTTYSGPTMLFRSNQKCERPAIPPVLPSGDPAATISLKDLEPYTTPAVELEHRPASDFDGDYKNRLENWDFDGHHVMVYKAVDGMVRAAVRQADGSFDVFARYSSDDLSMFFFNDLFGRDGFTITYRPEVNAQLYPTDTDYYYFDESGVLVLLARCHEEHQIIDLDGDGQGELVSPRQMFFQRDGLVYEARLDTLLLEACPELSNWDWEEWDPYARCLYANGLTEYNAETGAAMWERYLYFDGENILVYRDEKPTRDHMVEGIDAGIPAEVVAQAKAYVESILSPQADGTWLPKLDDNSYVVDDWRIEDFTESSSDQVGDAVIEGWSFNYELHTPTPEKVLWAGGRYVTEDGWVSPGYPGCDWMFFHNEGGKLTYLDGAMLNDMFPGTPAWQQYMEEMAQEHGLDDGKGRSAAARQIQEDLDYFMALDTICYNYQTGDGESHFASRSPDEGNARNRQLWFTQPDTYRWSYALTMPDYQAGDYAKAPSLTISDDTWERYLRFWPDSNYVLSVKPGEGGRFYKVENLTDPEDVFYENSQIFNFMRLIYDEAEFTTLRAENLKSDPRLKADFTDDFKLYDWARAWATQYEAAHSQVTPGSSFAFSWQKVIECDVMDQTDTSMRIWYTLAFTPENETARMNSWAGNTDEFKNFPNPDPDWGVPDGALTYSRVLRLEKVDGAWTFTGNAGTG